MEDLTEMKRQLALVQKLSRERQRLKAIEATIKEARILFGPIDEAAMRSLMQKKLPPEDGIEAALNEFDQMLGSASANRQRKKFGLKPKPSAKAKKH